MDPKKRLEKMGVSLLGLEAEKEAAIWQLTAALGIPLGKVAAMVGVTTAAISHWRSGKNPFPLHLKIFIGQMCGLIYETRVDFLEDPQADQKIRESLGEPAPDWRERWQKALALVEHLLLRVNEELAGLPPEVFEKEYGKACRHIESRGWEIRLDRGEVLSGFAHLFAQENKAAKGMKGGKRKSAKA